MKLSNRHLAVILVFCLGAVAYLGNELRISTAAIAAVEADMREKDPRPSLTRAACGDMCVIRNSPGGYVSQFKDAARSLVEENILLVLDGTCGSACNILVDDVHRTGGRLCVTDRAFF